jgi:squalene-associated FAD-dependent desaturase
MDHRAQVAVIGGGYAGCAAAATLAARGVACTLFETAPVLGGRARRVLRDGLRLDNGQHLLLGAYEATLALLEAIGAPRAFARRPLAIVPFTDAVREPVHLEVRRAPGRLGLLIGLLAARGLTVRERMANLAWFRSIQRAGFVRPPDETVAQLLAPLPPRVARLLWEPLNLAALNTPADRASAQVFANVVKAAFAGRAEACDFIVPTTDLSDFLPEQAARFVSVRDGRVALATRAQVSAIGDASVSIATAGSAQVFDAAVVAVGPHQLEQALATEVADLHSELAARVDAARSLCFEAIVTVWLGYRERVEMPGPVARLDDRPGQWVFDRPDVLRASSQGLAQMFAVVISANGPHLDMPHEDLARAVDAQLRKLAPELPACAWSFVVAEKRATYACVTGRPRAGGPRLAPRLYLAGDYVNEAFPATLEAAVRSGVAAADALLADRDMR